MSKDFLEVVLDINGTKQNNFKDGKYQKIVDMYDEIMSRAGGGPSDSDIRALRLKLTEIDNFIGMSNSSVGLAKRLCVIEQQLGITSSGVLFPSSSLVPGLSLSPGGSLSC